MEKDLLQSDPVNMVVVFCMVAVVTNVQLNCRIVYTRFN